MKKKRLLVMLVVLFVVSIGVLSIYKITYEEEFNYVVLGDSLAAGRNPYGVEDYGYTDYVRDYLHQEKKLKSYVSYAVSGYTVTDVNNDINYNRSVSVDNQNIGIKKALRESDLVTISIGANDFLEGMSLSNIPSNLSDIDIVQKSLEDIFKNIDDLLKLIKQYAKGDIIVVGYYNPFPSVEKYKSSINQVINYIDSKYNELCNKNNVFYIKISDNIASDSDYLPNPLDIHPSKEGYEVISEEVIALIKEHIFN